MFQIRRRTRKRRQLKNVAETISAIESHPSRGGSDKVEIGPEVLSRYLPDEQDSLLPATPAAGASGSPFADEDKKMIIKAILDLKQEVDTLKNLVHSTAAVPPPSQGVVMPPVADEPEEQIASVEESPQADMNMRQMGEELIERALMRHGGKVKEAARELGISERTIYRKLAEKKKK